MDIRGNKAKFWILLIVSIVFPPLFVLWFAKYYYSLKEPKRLIWFSCFSFWLLIWVIIIFSCMFTQHASTTSFYQTPYYRNDDYSAKSEQYENNYYNQLKAADVSATEETPINNTDVAEVPKVATQDSMAGIIIAEADSSPYTRSDYGSGWNVGSGCNIRSRILSAQSVVQVQTSNGCTVTYGSWIDPYSGVTLTGNPYRGDGTENDLDIDHIIPLKYVNQHGGYAWSPANKQSYGKSLDAMNNKVYIAVSSSENRKKSDKGPSDYYPSNPSFRCEYATRWRDIAKKYTISLSQRDYDTVKNVLSECNVL